MNYDDILALVRAGYSKSEIDAMAAGSAAPGATTEQRAEAPAPAQEPPAPAVQAPAQQPGPATSTEALLQQLFGSVNTLTQAVQAQNRANITGNVPAQTVDDIAKAATARIMGVPEKE